jgi:hypothetical protein
VKLFFEDKVNNEWRLVPNSWNIFQ